MEENNLDGILMPPVALPAPPHGMIGMCIPSPHPYMKSSCVYFVTSLVYTGDLLPIICYCTLINLLHWPSGVVPVTTVREDESHYNKQDLPSQQRDRYASLAGKIVSPFFISRSLFFGYPL